MNYAKQQTNMKKYQSVGAHAAIEVASPHRLIQMLMEGALDKIAMAKGHLERGQDGKCGSHISWAISIIDGLRVSLDKSVEAEVTNNLERLYEYMGRRLLEANVKKDPKLLDEVTNLLREIKAGWDAIPEEHRNAHSKSNDRIRS